MSEPREIKKVVLAYSGGLDTSVILAWLKERYSCEVVAYIADLGQGEELDRARDKAFTIGASEVYVEDLREEFARDYVFPVLRANAVYEDGYLLGSAIGRPLIAARQIEIARRTGADAVAHGATGKGNDQVRFELAYQALNPDITIVTPWREWDLHARTELLAFAAEHGIPIDRTGAAERPYSVDANLVNTTYEGELLEDPAVAAPDGVFSRTRDLIDAADQPESVRIGFRGGDPVSLDGEERSPAELFAQLNEIASRHGVGRIDMVENRILGIKTRGVYESPAATVLLTAHRAVEAMVLDGEVALLKRELMPRYANLVYRGLWFAPERHMLQAAIDHSQTDVTGEVEVSLYKGNVTVRSRSAERSRYNRGMVTFEQPALFDQHHPEGYIRMTGLRLRATTGAS
ncbi:argininosuccinate synthase [Winogradskya humida]|uniref:Argininosuccinate synthase n=1 Tax=Winogradskya humida TaxID=113566 RepID=A0ABQ4A3N8_9ACTN|nr:argininosuccinate synthase [Actinoplanes humidus]GIE25470.1 argininosuccinate synthase [Actinoplanes humidus]